MLRCWQLNRLKQKNRKRRAATAVEMALIAPVFFMMLMGTMETSLIMLAQHLLENAAYNASRLGKTGYVTAGKTQAETVRAALDKELNSLAPLINTDGVVMDSAAYADLSNIGVPGQETVGLGTASQVVVYTVTYSWKTFTPLMAEIIGDTTGNVKLTARIVVRNEPYGG